MLYKKVSCAVDVNDSLTDWFDVESGVKQGCILSPTLFAMYIDDLVHNINAKNVWITCGECKISTLLYADDIVLIAPNEADLQNLINVVQEWCSKWQMRLNLDKTKVVHFRKKQRSNSR